MRRTTTAAKTTAMPARHEWLLLAALLACIPLSGILPASWATEGGVLENAQVAVLVAGLVLALAGFLLLRPGRIGQLALAAAPLWLLLAGRELSWGRVLLPEPLLDALHWYRPASRAFAIVLLLFAAYHAWRGRIATTLRQVWSSCTPWLCMAIILAAALGSTCAEGHMHCELDLAAPKAQLFEELCELMVYLGLFWMQASIVWIGIRVPLLVKTATPGVAD